MNYERYANAMAECAVKVRDDYDELTLSAYWEEFKRWTDERFERAMGECSRHFNRFPTVKQVYENQFVMTSEPKEYGFHNSFRCLPCEDTGFIEVYKDIGYEPIKNGTFTIRKHLNTEMALCHCDTADRKQPPIGSKRFRYGRFNENTMKVVTAIGPEEQAEELTEFVKNELRPANFQSEFDEWSR